MDGNNVAAEKQESKQDRDTGFVIWAIQNKSNFNLLLKMSLHFFLIFVCQWTWSSKNSLYLWLRISSFFFFFLVHYLIQEKHRSPHFPPVELEEIIKQFASNKKTISITNINIYKSKTLTEMNFKKLLQPTRTSNCF